MAMVLNEKKRPAKGIMAKLTPRKNMVAKVEEDLKAEYNMYMLLNNYGIRNNLLVK
ncbi:MAG: hypothetical protein ACOYI2_10475 [Bacillota bacterium]|jgi:hypothetical protein|nr:hypothetical protein [Clostridia bacterium]